MAHAVTTGSVGPVAWWRMDTAPHGMLAIIMGIMKGEALRGPSSWIFSTCSTVVWKPPMPDPTKVPTRSAATLGSGACPPSGTDAATRGEPAMTSPASATASSEAARANWVARSLRLASTLVRWSSGSKPLTSAATLTL